MQDMQVIKCQLVPKKGLHMLMREKYSSRDINVFSRYAEGRLFQSLKRRVLKAVKKHLFLTLCGRIALVRNKNTGGWVPMMEVLFVKAA
jgi:hypothetical protein